MKDTVEEINEYLSGTSFTCYQADPINAPDYLYIVSQDVYEFILERNEYYDGQSTFINKKGECVSTVAGLWYVRSDTDLYIAKGFNSYKGALQEALHKCMREAMALADFSRNTGDTLSLKR